VLKKSKVKEYDSMAALIGMGRAGALFLHSLFDGHPEFATLPGYFFKGWFCEENWEILKPDAQDPSWRQKLAQDICYHFRPQFDASSKKNVIGKPNGETSWLAADIGFANMGRENSQALKLDEKLFKDKFLESLKHYEIVDSKACFELIHRAFDEAFRNQGMVKRPNKAIFYHIHNPDHYEYANFINNYPNAKVLCILRHPIQMLESWIAKHFIGIKESSDIYENNVRFTTIVEIITNFFDYFCNPLNSIAETKGVKLEDIKKESQKVLPQVASWLGVENSSILYESEFMNLKYSRPSNSFNMISGYDTASIDAPVGRYFGKRDITILETLFWPILSVYRYTDASEKNFINDLNQIRPWLNEPLQIEKDLYGKIQIDNICVQETGNYIRMHAKLVSVWENLRVNRAYPHVMKPIFP
tara:strand:- start:488 stop:1735 length:1248 start_codon:yes stop_codon:yes gene_type:complete